MSFLLAVPSCMPGGLDAQMGMHFGHCDIYTIVEIEDNAIKAVGTLENVPHQQGGCMAPVQHLASHGVKALLAGGMVPGQATGPADPEQEDMPHEE